MFRKTSFVIPEKSGIQGIGRKVSIKCVDGCADADPSYDLSWFVCSLGNLSPRLNFVDNNRLIVVCATMLRFLFKIQ
jgi:hypothetical protein